ncbi:MAG TPA: addiction module protein [Burkholderiaceae bacterium]|nr:addiction module protein [Burkholderiaceae bacterium]
MPTQVEVLHAEAMKLTPEERAHLADRLLASLSEDAEVEQAWAVEVERRIAEVEAGRAQVVPASDAISRARTALK